VLALLAVLMMTQTPRVVLVSGQSLSLGLATGSAVSTSQALGNVFPASTYIDGTFQGRTTDVTSWPMGSLVEATIESPRSGLANYYATATGTPLTMYAVGKGGTSWIGLEPGTAAWGWTIHALESYGARGRGAFVGLYVVHGEGDASDGTTRVDYEAALVEWQAGAAAVGVRVGVGSAPLYLDQVSSWQEFPIGAGTATTAVPLAQYDAARDFPGYVVLVGPKYQYTYQGDGIHLTAAESRRMGAMAGKVVAYGPTWEPLWPSTTSPITRHGAVITIPMHVPVPPMVLDTTNVTDPGSYGFTYTDDGTPPAISSVALDGSNVVVTLASTPTGANKKIRYALATTALANAGRTTGPRGCLRDSDPATWSSGALYNWAVHFEEAVP
jgi:hypothetical protein